jgi:DNA-binding NtrC family response regulator
MGIPAARRNDCGRRGFAVEFSGRNEILTSQIGRRNSMNGTASPAIIGSTGLVVTSDRGLARQLQVWLSRNYGCDAKLANTVQEADAILKANGIAAVFVDMRKEHDQAAGLFEQLSGDSEHSKALIAITDEASEINGSPVHGQIRLPLEWTQLSTLLRDELAASLFVGNDQPKKPWRVHFGTFSYETYSHELYNTLNHLATVATHDVTILLVGSTGTGKTTLARMVHELSARSTAPMLTVPCGALPPQLIESELFGHVKGSFTGADHDKTGKFEAAGTGTVLLDEIDVLDATQQAKLLRVIETGEFEPVGSNETRRSAARLIVATNENLNTLMEQNEFRSDLYYRLNVLEFYIPPLRERRLDIIPLTLSFIDEFRLAHGITIQRIHPQFLEILQRYDWPGNLRELKNHIRRAVLFCRNGELTPDDLSATIVKAAEKAAINGNGNGHAAATLSEKVASSERDILEAALRAHDFKRTKTAAALGISRVGLYKKMKKYGMLEMRAPQD